MSAEVGEGWKWDGKQDIYLPILASETSKREISHDGNFVKLIDGHLPNWQSHRDVLNLTSLAHEDWSY